MVGGLGGWEPEDEQAHLNELGQQGWELVAVLNKPTAVGRMLTYYYLKRAVHDWGAMRSNAPSSATGAEHNNERKTR